MRLAREHLERRRLERGLLRRAPGAAAPLDPLAPHRGEHARRLLAAHHRDAAVGPGPEEARLEGPPRHAVIAGPEGAADQQRDLRHRRGRDRRHQLRPVPRDALVLVAPPHHEAGDVLQEHQRDAPLRAELDEMRALHRALREKHAVVRHEPDRNARHMREAADQRRPEPRLELVEARAVHQPRNHLADVVGRAQIRRHHAEDLVRIAGRLLGRLHRHMGAPGPVQPRHRLTGQGQRMRVVVGEVIGNAREPRMHVAAAEVLGAHLLPGRGLHQRRAGEKDRALVAHDDAHIRHRRNIGPARGAGSHHHRDLGDGAGRHLGLIVEDAPEMLAVGKDLVLVRQVRAAAVHQIDAGQPVLRRDLLGAQVLLHRQRIIGPALHRGVIGHDHHRLALHPPHPGDQPRPRRGAVVEPMRRQRADLEKRRAGIEQHRHPLPRQHLAPGDVPRRSLRPAPVRRGGRRRLDLGQRRQMRRLVGAERGRSRAGRGGDHRHARGSGACGPGAMASTRSCRTRAVPPPELGAFIPSPSSVPARSASAGSPRCRRRSPSAWRRA